MLRLFIFKFIVSACLCSFSSISWARKVPGYIITNNHDTIYGEVDALQHSLYPGALVIAGIDLESYYYSVSFKASNEKSFKLYTADDISGFVFVVKATEYRFKRFEMQSNSLSRKEQQRNCFLNLLFSGELKLYRYAERKPNYTGAEYYKDQTSVYYDLYLYNKDKGLMRVEKTGNFKTLKALLQYYEVEEAFLETLPRRIKFKYVKDVLTDYEKWKYKKYIST